MQSGIVGSKEVIMLIVVESSESMSPTSVKGKAK